MKDISSYSPVALREHNDFSHIGPDSYRTGISLGPQVTYLAEPGRLSNEAEHRLSEDEEEQLIEKKPLPKDWRFYVVMSGMGLAWMVRGLDDTIISTISSELAAVFDSLADISWFSAAYLFPQAVLVVFFAKLTTQMNLNILWLAGTFMFLVGSLLCILATSGAVFIIGRAITGLGIAAITPTGLTMLTYMTTVNERPFYIAAIVSVEALSLALGPILAGVITQNASYRICFVLNFPLGAISCCMVIFFFKTPLIKHNARSWRDIILSFDPAGCLLLIMTTLFLLLGLVALAEPGNSKGKIIAFFVLGNVGAVTFVVQQYYVDPQIAFIPRKMLNRQVVLALFMGFLIVFCNRITEFFLVTFFHAIKGFSVINTGLALVPFLIMNAVGSMGTGIALKYSRYANPYMLTGSALIMLGNFLLSITDEHTSTATSLGFSIICGFGGGMGQLLAIGFAQQHVPVDLAPFTLSLVFMVQLLGGTTGVTIGGTVLNTGLTSRITGESSFTSKQQLVIAGELSDPQNLRGMLPEAVFEKVISLFAQSEKVIFLVSAGAATAALVVAIHQKWILQGGREL